MNIDNHTGFMAYFDNNSEPVLERNDYFDEKLGRIAATNWHTIDQSQLVQLEIWWHGQCKNRIVREDIPDLSEWIFYHSGQTPLGDIDISTVSRTIGFKRLDGTRALCTINEHTGTIMIATK